MPTCAKCGQPYHEDYDGCPACEKYQVHLLEKMRGSAGNISVIVTLVFLLVIVSTFASCMNGLGSVGTLP